MFAISWCYGSAMTNEISTFTTDDPESVVASESGTRSIYLARGKSGYAKIRHALVQVRDPEKSGSQPSTLGDMTRKHRALVLYLALLSNWKWLRKAEDPLPAASWIRFLRSQQPGALTWTEQTLSQSWGALEKMSLVERTAVGRLKLVMPRREDASGPYVAPDGNADSYFILPDAFWLEEYHATLSWPALAVLLILLKETGQTPETELPVNRAQRYYGISRTSAENGLADLRKLGLLTSRDGWIQDVNAGRGRRATSMHQLEKEFSTASRAKLRAAAKTSVDGKKPVSFGGQEETDGEESITATESPA